MTNCESYRGVLLEYLYDLLEGEERQAVQAHLEGCPACQAELARARGQQQLLSAAARMQFPDVRFTPPAEARPARPEAILLPTQTSPRRWGRWAAAAAVLLSLGAGSAVWFGREYLQAERDVAVTEARIAAAKEHSTEAREKLRRLPAETQERVTSLRDALRESQVQLKVQGPAGLHAGAPADFKVYATNLNGKPAEAKVTAKVMDQGQWIGRPVEAAAAGPGVYRLTLPPDLPIRPGSRPVLVVSARRDGGASAELREELAAAAPAYVNHLEIDKPMYRPGETVHFRSLALDRASLKPPEVDLNLQFVLTRPGGRQQVIAQGRTALHDEKTNAPVLGPDGKPLRGVAAGSFVLDAGWDGGEYALTVRDLGGRCPEERRKFLVNKYRPPSLRTELDFSRKSYGPGDDVAARCKAHYLDGRPVKNCPVNAHVIIDGKSYGRNGEPMAQPLAFRTDDEGTVVVRFRLPAQIERGLATLAVDFADPGRPDTILRPIPLVLKKLDIEFYPEGGDLVAGLSSRVYFQVRSTLGKPADLAGRLLEDGKSLDVEVRTLASEKEPELNQGMGRFEFTPKAGHRYELKVESPAGVTQLYKLPDVKPDGVVLSVPQGVLRGDESIPVTVRSTSKRSLLVAVYGRGRLLDSTELGALHFTDGEAHAVLKPTGGDGGVCRVTAFEVMTEGERPVLKPVSERLVYRRPTERVRITFKPDQPYYTPRQAVKLDVEATNEKGQPAPAIVMLRAIDKSVVTLADDKTLRSMPAHFLLTSEVRRPEDLEYADFLLGPSPLAGEALDLLLGTQGWRRFAQPAPGPNPNGARDESERVMVALGRPPAADELDRQDLARVEEEFARRRAELSEQAARADGEADAAREDESYRAAVARLAAYDDFTGRARLLGAPALAALLLVAFLGCLALAPSRRPGRAWPFYAAAVGCAAAAVLLIKISWDAAPLAPRAGDRQVARVEAPADEAPDRARPEEPKADEAKNTTAEADKRPAPQPLAPNLAAITPQAAPLGQPGMVPMFVAPGGGMVGAQGMPAANPAAGLMGMQGEMMGMGGMAMMGMGGFGGTMMGGMGMRGGYAPGQDYRFAQPGMAPKKGADAAAGVGKDAPMPMMVKAPERPSGAPAARMKMQMMKKMDARRPIAEFAEGPPQVRQQAMPMRVFAHAGAAGPGDVRHDFAETLYWHPALVLPGGKGQVSFDLCDSLGDFEVTAFAHTADGRLGSATTLLNSRLSLTVQPRVPLEVTAGDRIDVAVAVANNTGERRNARLAVTEHANLSLEGSTPEADVPVPAGSAARKVYRFRPTVPEGTAELSLTVKAEGSPPDSVRTSFRVAPEGFPVVASHSDVLEKSATHDLVLPETWVKGTLKCRVEVYPSTLADLQNGLEALLREPNGCFEQTSTSNYPNVLILQYLKESGQAKPAVERRARELLERGYQKLTSFECTDAARNARQGYEWFGGTAPPHEALTAYGLMEFRDMARVQPVDPGMLKRTQDYLLARRDGKGGFQRNPRALDTFGRAPENVTNAYIVWALTEGGKDDVTAELNALHEQAKTSNDPYFLALVANSLINRAKTADAVKLLEKVAGLQKDDGHLDAEKTSITGSGGRDLQIETTSLAVLGWLKANPGTFNANVQKAVRWIGRQRGGYGGFGSTQSTILALKALILYTKANKKTAEAGEVRLFVGEKQVATLPFAAGAAETLTLTVPEPETNLKPGKNPVRVEITGKNVFPYTLAWSYQTLQPQSAENCPVRVAAKLDRAEAREGETVRLNVRVENASGKGQGMAVAILGLPGGLTIPEDMKQLKDHTRQPGDGGRPLVSYFEMRGRELVLYWRDLAPDQKIEVPIDLICRIPGEYRGPASRAYLYYNADLKHWVEPLRVNITAKAE